MKNTLSTLLLAASIAAPAFADPADPQISGFSVSQDSRRVVSVSYTLDEPAYVTLDVLTNGVSIGGANIQNVVGDCFALVPAGTHAIQWFARKSWPDRRFDGPVVKVQLKAWAADVPPDVMDIDLETKAVAYYPSLDYLPDGGLANDKYRTTHLVMKKVHAAGETFLMGSPTTEANRGANEVQHRVSFTKDYYLAIYETTRRQYALMGGTENASAQLSTFSGDDPDQCPVGAVKYSVLRSGDWPADGHSAAGGFLGSAQTAFGIAFDLPTEAQWEFACRAGTTTAMYNGKGNEKPYGNPDVAEIAWYYYNSDNGASVHAVGGKPANPWGFHDMYGNLLEWCLDWYGDYDASGSVATDPAGPSSGTRRVFRSSHVNTFSPPNRSAYRSSNTPATGDWQYGFRLCVTLP